MTLHDAAKPFLDGFTYDPGHSDLDDDQPIWIGVTLGEWRRLNMLLNAAPQEAESGRASAITLEAPAVAAPSWPEGEAYPLERIDAARYRWLKECFFGGHGSGVFLNETGLLNNAAELDAAIDRLSATGEMKTHNEQGKS